MLLRRLIAHLGKQDWITALQLSIALIERDHEAARELAAKLPSGADA